MARTEPETVKKTDVWWAEVAMSRTGSTLNTAIDQCNVWVSRQNEVVVAVGYDVGST